ncbi:uncharacterized protein ycf23-like, partial [Phalaenopsis equestris]|uniref:uncharacterized protein ycf23-like n=1 Tax=Phalaenopsis equestris TaxID=78828 RepID=UPI0009E3A600
MAYGAVLGSFSVPNHCISGEFSSQLRKLNPLLRIFPPLSSRHKAKKPKSIAPATRASLSAAKEAVLRSFIDRKALKIISGLQNFDKEKVASVVIAAEKGGATHVDIACDPDLVKLAMSLTSLPVCVSSVDPTSFLSAVEAGARMIEIGNYDSFYEMGKQFSSDQVVQLINDSIM